MFLTIDEMNNNVHWLLQNASPAVKFLTHKYLLKTEPQALSALWEAVKTSSDAKEILSCQSEDGSWFSGGPWSPRGYQRKGGYTYARPKFVTTAWILPFLGRMGFTAADPAVQKGIQQMLSELESDGSLKGFSEETKNSCGLYATPLRAFASVGMAEDERLQAMWQSLIQSQRSDGGWLNPSHLLDSPRPSTTKGRWPWDRSCVWGSFYAAEALYHANTAFSHEAFVSACGFLLWHLSRQDITHIQTWVYHGHNIVKELLMFSEAGVDMTVDPIQVLLGWLKGYYHPAEGMFRVLDDTTSNFARQISLLMKRYEQAYEADYWKTIAKTSAGVLRYHLYHLIEDDWLTYYLTRIGLNLNADAD